MLPDYHLKIADNYNIPIGNVKKSVPNFFDKEKYVIHYKNLKLYLRLGLKLKNTSCIRLVSNKKDKWTSKPSTKYFTKA